MIQRILIALALGIGAGVWEAAAHPFLSAWLGVRPLLPILVLLLITGPRSRAVITASIGALFIDVFAVIHPDFAIIRYVILVLLMDAVANRWLTNRSLYTSLGLVMSGRLIEQGSAWLIGSTPATPIWCLLTWDVAIVTLGFLAFAIFTDRFATILRPAHGPGWYGG